MTVTMAFSVPQTEAGDWSLDNQAFVQGFEADIAGALVSCAIHIVRFMFACVSTSTPVA